MAATVVLLCLVAAVIGSLERQLKPVGSLGKVSRHLLGSRALRSRSPFKACSSHSNEEGNAWFKSYVGDLIGGAVAQGKAEKEARLAAGPLVNDPKTRWPWWFIVPIQPGEYRPTTISEVVPGKIWSFEQQQGALNIIVNIRMTVVKVKDGLLVYCPIAPTSEVIEAISRLEEEHGPVRYILLPVSAVEHKVVFGRFASKFPKAEVWTSPDQWSWPLPLPLSFLGLGFGREIRILGKDRAGFEDEVEVANLGPFQLNRQLSQSQFVESCIYHKPSRSLLVTDSLVYIPEKPLEICNRDPYGLLFHARDSQKDVIVDTSEKRQEGWAKTALLALFIRPACLDISDPNEPFLWRDWKSSFEAIKDQLIPAPFLGQLVFRRFKPEIESWLNQLSQWKIDRVIPGHFGIADTRNSKSFVENIRSILLYADSRPVEEKNERKNANDGQNDMKFLEDLDETFQSAGIIPVMQNKDK